MCPWGSIALVPAAQITRELLARADALLVRSVSRVDAALLSGTPVRFVGTATTGVDHIDQAYLARHGIGFSAAPGSNAESVVEYVLATLAFAAGRMRRRMEDLTVGIIGCGRIGGGLGRRLESGGVTVLRNDPPRARREGGAFLALDDILGACDLITVHTPLVRDGEDPTYHLIGTDQLAMMRPGAWLVNTSRGAVVDNRALLSALERGHPLHVALDVWENEPAISLNLLRRVDLATPHIAGYSLDAKLNGGAMVLEALARYFGEALAGSPGEAAMNCHVAAADPWLPTSDALDVLIRQMYDLPADDRRMRGAVLGDGDPVKAFVGLRREYPARRAFSAHTVDTACGGRHRGIERMLELQTPPQSR